MNFLIRSLSFIILFNLAACTHHFSFLSPPAVKQCKMVCVQHLEFCTKSCTDTCSACSAKAKFSSTLNYLKYVHEKQVRGGYIMRGLKSYRDPLQCRKISCNCTSDYIICKQGCTGVVQKRLQAVRYCT